MPRERPILMSSPMVKAILEGRKTQTRRLDGLHDINMVGLDGAGQPTNPGQYSLLAFDGKQADFARFAVNVGGINVSVVYHANCPYQVGDRLWVRETHTILLTEPPKVVYRADQNVSYYEDWRPSIFLPRWASRILLEITEVRVQRVQQMNFEDTMAEGCPIDPNSEADYEDGQIVGGSWFGHRKWFVSLWDSINTKHPWASNCWTWAISFKRLP